MTDHVPSIANQGVDVTFLQSSERLYNSGCIRRGGHLYFASRRYNSEKRRCDITVNRLDGDRQVHVKTLNLPTPGGNWLLADPRLFEHQDKIHVAYNEDNYDTKLA